MIQDIFPHVFHNEFHERESLPGDFVAGQTLALVKFVVKYMGKYVVAHGVLGAQ